MPSLKDVKLQIAGVGKTKQITRAMGMVASAKLRGAQNRIERFRPYAEKFGEMLGDLAARTEEAAHPLLQVHKKVSSAVIILLTSDRGLCGGFNVNLISTALELARARAGEGLAVRFICVGRKGRDAVRKTEFETIESYGDVMGSFDFRLAVRLGGKVAQLYESGEADEVYLVYSQFAGMTRQIPTTMALLPVISSAKGGDEEAPAAECLYEPEVGTLLAELLPRYVNVQIYRGLLDNSASENAARMASMDNATRNCDELTNSLTLLYNKTRQAAITNELIDIVGGANAQQSQ
ncbi:F0F1 ATP synthase subunit gamma [Mailhella massiliensis]|uniref:ATP synthase gamma chain n=1 Tax=Mailhella massiliensis TaxID=1903261 RepID=A0A921DRS5_9BACT|nr:F0F1 ATP synthase subunit gamma [Mailhella massiliensis]HJD97308.1 F0F1 ATP synthase subunit gamma [Mailhella massiliensis]